MRHALLSHAITAAFLTLVTATVYFSAEAETSPSAVARARDNPRRIHAETCRACAECRSSEHPELPDVIDGSFRADRPASLSFAPEDRADSR